MMRATAHRARGASSSTRSDPPRLLQRCSCGQKTGPSGECAQCRRKRRLGLQPKLIVNEAGDRWEREADRIADSVVAGPVSARPAGLQRSSGPAGAGGAPAPAVVHEALAEPGEPLEAGLRDEMERRLGHDFGSVRVHRRGKAGPSARAVGARAYTVGADVVFAEGEYRPGAREGRRLVAHELAHVVQQGAAAPRTGASERSTPSRGAERGQPAPTSPVTTLGSSPLRVARQDDDSGGDEGGCGVELCFLPLQALIDMGVSEDMAYLAAAHVFIRWNGRSAGFTRLDGDEISEARVHVPEPRAGDSGERCVSAELRTVPTRTPGQWISFSPLGAAADAISYGSDVVEGIRSCWNPSCDQAHERIEHLLTDDREGLYSLFDENCETWARNVLSAACMEAPELQLGAFGNIGVRILRETPGGHLYHLGRVLLGRTRPLPEP